MRTEKRRKEKEGKAEREGKKRRETPLHSLTHSSFLRAPAVYISFGGLFSLAVSQGLPHMDPSISKLLGALAFPVSRPVLLSSLCLLCLLW